MATSTHRIISFTTTMATLALLLTTAACGLRKKDDANRDEESSSPAGDEDELGPVVDDRAALETRAAEEVTTKLTGLGLTGDEVNTILAVAKTAMAAVPAGADAATIYYAFGNGALAQLNETLVASGKLSGVASYAKASAIAADLTGLIVALAEQDPSLHAATATQREVAGFKAYSGAVAGLMQLDLLAALAVPEDNPNLALSSVGSIGGFGANIGNITGLDLEAAMMAIQANRANLLETQLKDQIAGVQAKNDQIARLNSKLGHLNAMASRFPSDIKAGDRIKQYLDPAPPPNMNYLYAEKIVPQGQDFTKAEFDGYVQQLKSEIDGLSNSQQMDMLRLQSLSNKRNEAFDLMTNFIKKMQDTRASIVGNMRLMLTAGDLTAEDVEKIGHAFDLRMFGALASGYIAFTKTPNYAEETGAKLIAVLSASLKSNLTSPLAHAGLELLAQDLARTLTKSGADKTAVAAMITAFAKGVAAGSVGVQTTLPATLTLLEPLEMAGAKELAAMQGGDDYVAALATGTTKALMAAYKAAPDAAGYQAAYRAFLTTLRTFLQAGDAQAGKQAFSVYASAAKAEVMATAGINGAVKEAFAGPLTMMLQAP